MATTEIRCVRGAVISVLIGMEPGTGAAVAVVLVVESDDSNQEARITLSPSDARALAAALNAAEVEARHGA